MNIRKLRTQITPQNNDARNERLRSKDRQLIIMLLIQVLITILCTLPFSVVNITSMIFQYLITLFDYGDAINTFYTFRNEMKCMIMEAIRFILTKLGLERFIPSERQGQVRRITHEKAVSTMLQEIHEQLEKTIRMSLQTTLNQVYKEKDLDAKNRFAKYSNQLNDVKTRLQRETYGNTHPGSRENFTYNIVQQ
ncbi:unnamed protein product [Rotaria sordida]|uniref:Uncharacterized protein n=1 Tax=Rotaria sordida TaxID=392033 RepID=A0A814ZYZ1_9BILA|nr:unnamed protein product [Rotaria sordida]CAF4084021.1 unnamed protein product [Rotaria sordida]